ncbi:hypothetical protein VC95412_000804B, partial [Vibrio cholerae O1 str. 95412]
ISILKFYCMRKIKMEKLRSLMVQRWLNSNLMNLITLFMIMLLSCQKWNFHIHGGMNVKS